MLQKSRDIAERKTKKTDVKKEVGKRAPYENHTWVLMFI